VRVPSDLPGWRRAAELVGRRAECAAFDQLIRTVRSGQSRTLVVHGEPGVGKTALLEYVAVQALGCRVVRGGGVQSEMELAFAGLHQLCAPLLGGADDLPAPQRDALHTAFGISTGPPPDVFLVGLAVLSLLSDVAADRPLICLVDDQQWLDRASARVLAFVGRRLGEESVGLVFATRTPGGDLAGLPDLPVGGLRTADARDLLDSVLTGPLDERVRDQIVAETGGNPLALLELPRGLAATDLAGGFGLPGAVTVPASVEESFGRRYRALSAGARDVLLIAASDPSGDPALVNRAIAGLGIGPDEVLHALEADLAEFGTRVRFRHPLARSAVYRSASRDDRQRVHTALAAATDPDVDPDRRAWHRAQAAPGPDADVAAELEHSAGRAMARGGIAAAAAFLRHAARLTPDAARRAGRALAAAASEMAAGAFDVALELLSMAAAGPLTDLEQAQADLIRARLAFLTNRGSDAAPLLLQAARRLEPIDAGLSRATYLDALSAAIFAGRLAGPDGDVLAVARAAGEAPAPPGAPGAVDLLLDGTTATYTEGAVAGLPTLRAALADFGTGMSTQDELHWLWLAGITTMTLCDDAGWDTVSARHVDLARRSGALGELPLALTLRALFLVFTGDLTTAAALAGEAQAIREATGTNLAPYGALAVAAFRRDDATWSVLFDATVQDVTRRGEGVGITMAEWAHAVLCNGLGRYDEAGRAARRSAGYGPDHSSYVLPCAELIEAAVRSGQPAAATDAYRRLADVTDASGTDWALGIHARCQALLCAGDGADRRYREAIAHLERTRLRVDLARAHLLYGEWLRRERRHSEAREHLRTAHTRLEEMGIAAFAERAARELRAAGGTVRKRVDATPDDELTAQETLIARLARDGLSNPEIATRLFISARTVQYHLRKVFTKLGVTSRGQLAQVLPRS
jgi:DNA-binding CsgD family transcriptional regulator